MILTFCIQIIGLTDGSVTLTGDTDTTRCNGIVKEYLSAAYEVRIEDRIPPVLNIVQVIGIDHGVVIRFVIDEPSKVMCSAQRIFNSPWNKPNEIEILDSRQEIQRFLTTEQKENNGGVMDLWSEDVGVPQEFRIENLMGGERYMLTCWAEDRAKSVEEKIPQENFRVLILALGADALTKSIL